MSTIERSQTTLIRSSPIKSPHLKYTVPFIALITASTLLISHSHAAEAPASTPITTESVPASASTKPNTVTSTTHLATPPGTVAAKPPTPETQLANLSKQTNAQTTRLNQLEIANRDALTRNQTLQLENDNLTVQVKVLQSDRGAQMFIYGAVAILIGAFIGYLCASYFMRRNRRW